MRVLLRVIVKEFLELLRDRTMIPVLFVAPALQLLALGYAANLDVRDIPTVLVDQDRTPASLRLVDAFTASGYFRLVASEDTAAGATPWLVNGRGQVALVIRRGYGEAVAAGRTPEIQVLADGSDSSAAGIGLGYAALVIAGRSAELVAARLPEVLRTHPGGRAILPGSIELVPRVWYNPDLRSRWFFVPAVLAMVLMVLTLVLSSMGVVREKEIGTMEQLIVTPIRPWQLILGKLLPYAAIGLFDTFVVVGLTVGLFGVPLRGSLALLVTLTLALLLNTLSLGLLVSTLVTNQQQAMMMAVFLFMLPMIYLSGLLFPVENMPDVLQWVSYAIPLRYYAQILRGIFLRGLGISDLWPQAAALTAFGIAFLTLSALRFRKRLD